ncbi:carboxypeptidase-like regulatory domain-containing protein [Bdellovibrio sp. HCB185ZH]|uniref:carboxypeptidase-like regulatory domain-containing protein n=1 Tax=Bdellovibrio sp. HCB185ZH TaxID=3394235 RepID=UPI0039A612AA
MKLKIYFLLGLSLLLGACASNQEKQEMKNPLEVLNGQNYNAREDSQLGGVPVTGTKNKVTRIRGVILQGEGVAATPVKFISVRLLDDDGVTIANATSDIKGAFVLSGIFFNGHYVVEITSKKFKGATRVYVNRYEQEITIQATPVK